MTIAVSTETRGKALPAGIYSPTITFFKPTPAQELDLDVFTKHIEFLATSGLHGVVVLGSTGEAVTLSREERKDVSLTVVHSLTYDLWYVLTYITS
jgi:4-hydroxy-2-oxoglutarate aldolase